MTNELKLKWSQLINGTTFSILMAVCTVMIFGVRMSKDVEHNEFAIHKHIERDANEFIVNEAEHDQLTIDVNTMTVQQAEIIKKQDLVLIKLDKISGQL